MIVPDLNLLIYAYNEESEFHQQVIAWWTELVNGTEPVGMPWQVSDGFVRQMANPSILAEPWTPAEVTREVARWFSNDHFIALNPGPRYLEILERFLSSTGNTTRLVPDATIRICPLVGICPGGNCASSTISTATSAPWNPGWRFAGLGSSNRPGWAARAVAAALKPECQRWPGKPGANPCCHEGGHCHRNPGNANDNNGGTSMTEP